MRTWIALGALGLVVAMIVARALTRDGVPFDGTTLSHSLERVLGGGSAADGRPAPCVRGRRFQYRCRVHGTSGSDTGPTYRVTATGEGCWEAVKVRRESAGRAMPRRARGCVKEVDQPN